jgi:DNA adenine methylase
MPRLRISSAKQKWIVSYDNVRPVRQLYHRYEKEGFGLRYSAQDRYAGKEVMIFCSDLVTPYSVQPWRGIAA